MRLSIVPFEILFKRREKLLNYFGYKCTILDPTNHLFKRKETLNQMKTRNPNKYDIVHANTDRLRNSTGPYIQRLLNKNECEII